MDYPVQSNRWRTRALILAGVAAIELFVLAGLGVLAAGKVLAGEVATVAREHEAPAARRAKPPTAPDRPVLERSETSVAVLNGNGIAGAAAQSAARIRALTYVVSGTANAPRSDYARTIVMYRKGFRREAERLAADAGIKRVGQLDGLREADLMGAHLALVLGR